MTTINSPIVTVG